MTNNVNLPAIDEKDQRASAKYFCATFFWITLIAFSCVATLNFVVNPFAHYTTAFFTPVVQTSRSQKVSLLRQHTEPPAGLILGSSRVLKLEPAYLASKFHASFFNAGVNYAKPEDFLAFLRLYRDQFDGLPKFLIVGLDVNAFSHTPVDNQLLNNKELAGRAPEAVSWKDGLHRWKALLSWNQTKHSFRSVYLQLRQREETPVESFLTDGQIVYHQREKQIAAGNYDFAAALDYNKNEYRHLFREFKSLSKTRCRIFKKMLQLCHNHHIRTFVFLTPMHPQLESYLKQKTRLESRRRDVVEFVQAECQKFAIQFQDLSQLQNFNGDAKLFVDGIHPLEQNTRRMIDVMFTENDPLIDVQ